jgi:hypothetical protein
MLLDRCSKKADSNSNDFSRGRKITAHLRLGIPVSLLFGLVVLAAVAIAQSSGGSFIVSTISRLSAPPDGATPNGGSGSPAQAANGRFLAFSSTSSNLVSGDQNSVRDIFLRDQARSTITRLSVTSSGIEANNFSDLPSISPVAPNGFFAVAFSSVASNLSGFIENGGFRDIFVRLPATGITFPLTVTTSGILANGDSDNASTTIFSEPNQIAVAFESEASNLVFGDFNGVQDLFLTVILESDALAGKTPQFIRISRGAFGAEANGPSFTPKISGDGRFVVFASSASNLLGEISVPTTQIYLYDVALGTTTLVSKSASGQVANDDSFGPSINYDGSVITFASGATNLVTGQSSTFTNRLYVVQRASSTVAIVNASSNGGDGDGNLIGSGGISPDGRFVAFSDSSSNIVSGDTNGVQDLFARDLTTGAVARVSTAVDGSESDGTSDLPVLSGNSFTGLVGTVSFRSNSSSLVPGSSGNPELFGRQIQFNAPAVTKQTTITVPPDLSVGNRSIAISAKKFSGFVSDSTRARSEKSVRASKKITIAYDFRLQLDGARRDARRKTAQRNVVSFRGLSPGTYTASYRTLVKRGTKVTLRTSFSPAQRFSVAN